MREIELKLLTVLYRLALWIARPLVRVRLRRRARSEPAYAERVAERFGRVPASIPSGCIWFHTVSAGETIAAAPLIARLLEEFPEQCFLVTTMTPSGSAQVAARLGDRVAHCYAPYDFPDSIERFFDQVKPRLLVLMETELWPNMLRKAHQRAIPALLVNARLSHRSAAGYARIRALTRQMLGELSFIACQYPDHAERFLALGADPAQMAVMGSIKFDITLPVDHARRVEDLTSRWQLMARRVWIAGSTHPGEELAVLQAHALIKNKFADALLILVPRHPSRCDAVAELIEQASFSCARTSQEQRSAGVDVILADTMGQLEYLYGLSEVAFLGGSLVPIGGHNPIEAAICAQPLIMGTQVFNFPDVVAAFTDAQCLESVENADQLAEAVVEKFTHPERAAEKGRRAKAVVEKNRGATQRLMTLLRAELQAVS